MKLKQITSFLIIILVLINASGCTGAPIGDEEVIEFNVTTEEQSQKIAENYVRNMNEYKDYEGRDLELIETLTARCPYSWSFKYEFDMVSEKNADVVDRATVEVLVQEGEVVDVVFSAGMKDEEKSGDILNVYELLENPVYGVEVGIYGRVSLLDELLCPCFELASGGEEVQVWYNLMVEDNGKEISSVSVEGVENGDWVIVRGELKTAGEHRSLNDFWASSIEKPVSSDKSYDGGEIKVPFGKILIVNLDSNPSTGFSWNLIENSNESVLKVVGNEFVIDETTETPLTLGIGGREIWIFRAQKEGTSKISMKYIRLWEEDVEPAETFVLRVFVE